MEADNGGSIRAWKGAAARSLRGLGRIAADLILPPVTPDRSGDLGAPGLMVEDWSRVTFLEAPVCDGCGAAFEHDGGAFAQDRCVACLARPYLFSRARAACVYDDASRGLILGFKHGDQQQYAPLFARWVERAASELIARADVAVPVPLHPMRLLKRRFNQAAEIARPLARATGLTYRPDALRRIARTDSQGAKGARARRVNVKGAFTVPAGRRSDIEGLRILLIDDVLTTGATAEACARTLLDAGAASVDLAVIARVRNARELSI